MRDQIDRFAKWLLSFEIRFGPISLLNQSEKQSYTSMGSLSRILSKLKNFRNLFSKKKREFTTEEIRNMMNTVPNWYHKIELAPGIVTPGINDTPTYFSLFNFPENCEGLRVLDLGTRDGYFAFEFERRGAEVVAIDYFPAKETGFAVAAEILGSKIKHRQANIYDLSAEKLGRFDLVLMLGLIYHLPDPMLALDLGRKLSRDKFYLETQVIDRAFLQPDGSSVDLASLNPELSALPIMQFYPRNALNGDYTNYWAPNETCMQQMLEENRFKVLRKVSNAARAIFECETCDDPELEHWNQLSRGIG